MRYILDRQYALRSWEGRPFALAERNVVIPWKISRDDFIMLKKCDGEQDLPYTPELQNLLDRGLCHPCQSDERLTEWQKPRFYSNRCVPSIYLMITGRCNLNCLHCFNASDNNASADQFSLEDLDRLTDDAAATGVQGIWITGGEPMIHPHFLEIVRMIYRKDMFVPVLVTNGMFLTDTMLDELQSIGFKGKIMVSFDGIGHHDRMRQHVGAEKITIETIKRLIARNINILVNMNLNHSNEDTFDQTLDCLDSLGVHSIRVIRTVETPRWKENGGSDSMSPADFYELSLASMRNYMSKPHRMQVLYREFACVYPKTHQYSIHPVVFEDEDYNPNTLSCGMVRQRIAIGANGEIYPCMQASGYLEKCNISFGNWYKEGLEKQFTKSPYLDLASIPVKVRHDENDECCTCSYFKQCLGGCRMQAMLTSGSINGPDRIRCDFFKNGFKERIIELADQLGWQRRI